MRLLRPLAVLLTALQAVQAATSATDDGATSCWLVDTSALAVVSTYSGAECPVQVLMLQETASLGVGENVTLFWAASLLNGSSNEIGMPLPPPLAVTLSADNAGKQVQIVATYARTCSARDECDPTDTTGASFSTVQSGNFTSQDKYFSTADELAFSETGTHVVSAVVVVDDDVNATLAYYFAAFADVVVADKTKELHVEYDKATTYCRESSQDPLDESLSAGELVASNSSCEVAISIDGPDVAQVGVPVTIEWEAVLDSSTSSAIQLPSPLVAVDVAAGSATGSASAYYTIVSSVLKICSDKNECSEYSDNVNISSKTQSANFSTDDAVSFSTTASLPAVGWYSGLAQITLSGEGGNSRFDFMTYFNMVATEGAEAARVESETYATDNSVPYCWEVLGSTEMEQVISTSVYAMGTSSECPYTVTASISNTSLTASKASLAVNWTVTAQSQYSTSTFVDVNQTAVYDATTGEYVEIAQVNIYACNASVTSCTPFSADKITLYSASPSNFSDSGEASFSASDLALPNEGTYVVIAHVVIPNGDDSRFDVASFMTVQGSASSSSASSDSSSGSGSNTAAIIGIVVGCVGALVIIIFAVLVLRRRRRQQHDLEEPSTTKGGGISGFRPLSVTNELPTDSRGSHVSNGSEESGSFMYVKAQKSPIDDEGRYSSLSYDPYSRRSFTDMALENSGYSFVLSDQELSQAQSPRPGVTPATYPA